MYYFKLLAALFMTTTTLSAQKTDWQGHRGTRGLMPENTIPAFIRALELGVTTLELDICISADSHIVVSHEPWMSHEICSQPDGTPVSEVEATKYRIYKMTLAEVQRFDCGKRGNARFPQQQAMRAYKPALFEVVEAVNKWCIGNNKPLPNFNIEIKSAQEYYGKMTPFPAEYVRIVLAETEQLRYLMKGYNIQSFDANILKEVHKQYPEMVIALLVENKLSVAKNIDLLGFTPQIYSPYYLLLTKQKIKKIHRLGMKVIPWTVNETELMQHLIDIGADGIITDYPDRIPKL